jgi:hypothetical protein
MDTATPYSFRMTRTSYKSQDLVYEEPGHRLVVYLEMSGIRKYDWIACDAAAKKWTKPKGEEIPDQKRAEIMERLSTWSAQQKVRIGFGPPLDLKKMFEAKGYTVSQRADGVMVYTPPPKRGVVGLFARFSRKKKNA